MSKFVKVENTSHLIPTVEGRLPASCYILNQLKSYEQFTDDMEILSYGENKPESLWLITTFKRADWGVWISISCPAPQPFGTQVPEDVKDALFSGEIFNWDDNYLFTALPIHLSKLIVNKNLEELGRVITMYPCYLFHMKPEDALKLDISPPPGVQLKRLELETGSSFLADNWKYTRNGTLDMVKKGIGRLPSAGVFPDETKDQPVCGALTPGFGLVSMLHTNPEHRRKGYAKLVMHFIFKELAKEGLQPCLVTELRNTDSLGFHRSLGLTQLEMTSFVGN